MADFPVGARVRIGQCEGEVKGNDHRVIVQFPGVGFPGYFDPKFVHLVQPENYVGWVKPVAAAPNQTAAGPREVCCLRPQGHGGRHTNKVGWSEPSADGEVNESSVQPVVDSELRDRLRQEWGGELDRLLSERNFLDEDDQMTVLVVFEDLLTAVVAPVLAANGRADEKARIALADALEMTHSLTVYELIEAAREYVTEFRKLARLKADMSSTHTLDRDTWKQQLERARTEIERLESNEEFSDRALHLVLGCCDPATMQPEDCKGNAREVYDALRAGHFVPYHWPTIHREFEFAVATRQQYAEERDAAIRNRDLQFAEVNDAKDAIARLMADLERERARHAERDQVNASWVAYQDRKVRERREHQDALGAALGIPEAEIRFNPIPVMVESVAAMRAELDALKARAVVLPDNLTQTVGGVIESYSTPPPPRVLAYALADVIRSWRPDTEATEQAEPLQCDAFGEGVCCRNEGHDGECDPGDDSPATPTEPRAVAITEEAWRRYYPGMEPDGFHEVVVVALAKAGLVVEDQSGGAQ